MLQEVSGLNEVIIAKEQFPLLPILSEQKSQNDRDLTLSRLDLLPRLFCRESMTGDEPAKLHESHQERKLSKDRLHFISRSRISPHNASLRNTSLCVKNTDWI